MKRYIAILIGMMLILSTWSTAFAASVTAPALKCDGSSVDSQDIVEYDLADGTLTIKWTPQSSADHYYYKCIGLNEKPDFWDSYQGDRGTTLAEGTVTSNTTSKCKFTVSTSKMEDFDYLKIAVAAYDSAGTAYWTNFGVDLFDSDKIVTNPAVTCDGSSVDHKELVSYDLADGTLTIKWTPQTAADHYYYKCIGLNEAVDFGDDKQGNRGTTLAEGEVTSNTTSKCKFTLSTSKMEGYSNLKIAIAAYDSDGVSYWTNFGVQLSDSSATELALSATSLSLDYAGETNSVTVSGASSFSVSHPTEDEEDAGKKWLTVSKSGSTIKITARANYSASSRSEKITVTSSDGQTKTITVTQKAGYAAPTASIRIGNTAYSSGATYGPLANGGEDILWLYVDVQNARRIHVATGTADIEAKDLAISASSSTTSHECAFAIPKGLAAGTYTFTVYVSNSDVKNDAWSQAITPITLNVTVVNADTSSHKYALLGGYIDYIPGQDYFTASKTKECTGSNSVSGGSCQSVEYDGAWQCAGFAKYVEYAIYGGLGSYLDGKTSGLLSSTSVTSDALKTLIQRAGVGANVRAGTEGTGHSMIVTSISDTGFEVIHANWDNYCGISTKWFSWDSFKTWLNGKGYGIAKIRVHNPGSVSTPTTAPSDEPTTTPTTFSGSINGLTVRLGETAQLNGQVTIAGSSSINRVTVNVQGYYAAEDSRVFTKTFTNGETTVNLQNYSEFVIDTSVAPFNVAGTYTIRLWASAHDGTSLTQPIAEATVVVAENVSSLPAYTEDELYQHLYHTLGVNEGSYGTVNANDNGSASVGKIQWNANAGRALPLLKKIVAKNPADARSILGDALYNEIAGNSASYWTNANRVFTSDEKSIISKLLSTSYGVEVQEAQIKYDLTTKNLATIRNRGVTDPWAIVYLADIFNVGDYTKAVINNAIAEVGSADKITLDIAHKYTKQSSVYGTSTYANRLNNTYNYLKGVTFNGKHYNDSTICAHSACTWSEKNPASCSAEGLEEYICNSCGDVLNSRAIAKTSHTVGEWVIITNATETSTGLKRQSCTVCGASVNEEVIPMVTPDEPEVNPPVAGGKLTISNGTLNSDGDLEIIVGIENNPGIAGCSLAIDLPEIFSSKTYVATGVASSAFTLVEGNMIGIVSVVNMTADGNLIKVTLGLDNVSVAEFTMQVSCASASNVNGTEVVLSGASKQIRIPDRSQRVPGDVDENSDVNWADVILTLKHVMKLPVNINLSNAEVTGDGDVNWADVILLLKHVMKLPVELK